MLGARITVAILGLSATLVTGMQLPLPAPAAAGQDRAPTIDRVSIGPDGTGMFAGLSMPGARIALTLEGRAIGQTIADAEGGWQLRVAQAFAAGEHRVKAVARAGNNGEPGNGATIRISIPAGFGSPPTGPGRAADTTEQSLFRRASELADRASRGFDELLPELTGAGTPGMKLAAIQDSQATAQADSSIADAVLQWLASVLADAQAWLESSARDYQSVIVRRLSDPAATAPTGPTAREPSPVAAPDTAAAPRATQPPDAVQRAEAERLRKAEADRAAEAARAAAVVQRALEAEARRKTAEAERIASAERAKAEAEARRKTAEAERIASAERARAEAEARRRAADETRLRQEAARADAEAKRKVAEAQRLAAAEAARRQAEDQREAAEAALRQQEVRAPASVGKPEPSGESVAALKAAPPTASLGRRTASRRTARRYRRPAADQLGSEPWCNFFYYRYPMELLDPGQWQAAVAERRR